MSNAATEAPAAYVLATQFHELMEEMADGLMDEHLHLAMELQRYAERLVGNVGAAEAPYAVERRQSHYQMAFAAACGCAAGCDMVLRFRLAPVEQARRANRLLRSLATMIQPIAEEGMEPRSEMDQAILDEVFGAETGTEPWEQDDDGGGDLDDDMEDDHGRAW